MHTWMSLVDFVVLFLNPLVFLLGYRLQTWQHSIYKACGNKGSIGCELGGARFPHLIVLDYLALKDRISIVAEPNPEKIGY